LHQWAIALFAEQGIVVTAADIKSNCIALPYWAWEHDAGKTASGRAFSEPSTLGSSGWGQSGNCVADGLSKWTGVEADADWLIAGTPKCLKRSYNPAGTVNTFDLSQWASMLTISGYCSFANSAEGGIHYAPHTYVSGTMGSVSTAGREHLFYLHHNNIDRLWSEWQEYAPGNKFDYDDCGTSKGVNDPMPPFDGTTYAEATPADVLDQSNYWKHKCVRPKWGPFFVSKLKATQAQATHLQQRTLEAVPLAWPVALRTSRTCYGADYVPHGRKCKFVVDGWLSHAHQVKMKLAKVWDAGLGGQIPGLGALMDKTQKDAMFDTAKWREFGFTEDMTRNLAARFTRSQLSQEEIARWAPHLDPANKREVFGGIPEDWITEGFLDELINKIDHADTCKSDGSRHGLQIEDGE
jgi:tyrosinase